MVDREAWLKAVEEAFPVFTDDPEAITARAFAEMCACSIRTARERLAKMVQSEVATQTWRTVTDGDGRARHVPAYRLVERHRTRQTVHRNAK